MHLTDTITAAELLPLLGQSDLLLIDILTEDAFAERHLPAAQNVCTYEMVFVEKFQALVNSASNKNLIIVIYGESDTTLEASEALSKLHQAGLTGARRLIGGIEAWIQAGFTVEKSTSNSSHVLNGLYKIDLSQSLIRWSGSNLFNHHLGTLGFSGGQIEIADGQFRSGGLTIDVHTLRCDDIPNPAMNSLLIQHLQSEDFFAADRFPTATFTLDHIEIAEDTTLASTPNAQVAGRLLLRGIEKPIRFPALIAAKPDGICVAQARVTIDRTEWGLLYGSSKFFARLANHFVSDLLHLHLKIVMEPGK